MSKFTSILKDIGLTVAQAGLSYMGLGELAGKLIKTPAPPPGVVPQKLQDLWDLVKRAEFNVAVLQRPDLTGADKLAMVAPSAANMILDIDDFRGHKPEDEEEFKKGVDDLASAMVRIGNSYKKK